MHKTDHFDSDDEVYIGRVKVREVKQRLKHLGLESKMTTKLIEHLSEDDYVPQNLLDYYMLLFKQRSIIRCVSDSDMTSVSKKMGDEPRSILRRLKHVSFNTQVKFLGSDELLEEIKFDRPFKKLPIEAYPGRSKLLNSPIASYIQGTSVPLKRNVVASDDQDRDTPKRNVRRVLELPVAHYKPGKPVMRIKPITNVGISKLKPIYKTPQIIKHDLRVKSKDICDVSQAGPSGVRNSDYDISILSTKPVARTKTLRK